MNRLRILVVAVLLLAAACTSTSTPTTSTDAVSTDTTVLGRRIHKPKPPKPTTTTLLGTSPTTGPTTSVPGLRVLPDPVLTPGATNPNVTQQNIKTTICVKGFTATIRPPVSVSSQLKSRAMINYHVINPTNFEGDHLISLELGGAPADLHNFWPEPWSGKGAKLAPVGSGAEDKDKVENALRAKVCAGTLTLADAQHRIATDWTSALR